MPQALPTRRALAGGPIHRGPPPYAPGTGRLVARLAQLFASSPRRHRLQPRSGSPPFDCGSRSTPSARAKRPALNPASQRVSAPLSKIATSSRSPSTRATPAPAPLPLPTSLCVSGHAARLSSLARRGYSLSCAACPIARRRLPRKAALWPKKQRRPCVSRLPCTLSLHRSFRPLARAIPSSARRAYARCATWLTPMMPPPEVTATSLPPSAQFRQPRPSWLSPRTPSWAAN